MQRIVDGEVCEYHQAYLINEKLEETENDRTKVKVQTLFVILMEEKTTAAYREMWLFLKEIFFLEYPECEDLQPTKLIMDFEKAAMSGAKSVFEGIEVQQCSFHLLSNVNKHFKQYYSVKRSENATAREIWGYLKGLPYLQWNEQLVSELMYILQNIAKQNFKTINRRYSRCPDGAQKKILKKELKTAQGIIDSTKSMCHYLKSTYLSSHHASYSYRNWSIYTDVLDKTNNTSETANKQFNRHVLNKNNGYQSFVRFVHLANDFIAGQMENELVSCFLYKNKLTILIELERPRARADHDG